MKKFSTFAGVIALGLCLFVITGCGPSKRVLNLYNWSDYIDPDLVKEFEEQFDCRVLTDTFDSNEAMYAKLKAGAKGYDLMFPTSYMAEVLFDEGLIQELDLSQVPNVAHVDKKYLATKAFDKTMRYSVPYMMGTTGIAYLEGKAENVEATWDVFSRKDLAGRMTMMNDMRETLGAALKYLGYSLNTTNESQIRAAGEQVKKWKANLAKFENEQYKSGIASGEFFVVHGYSGDILQVQEDNENVVYLLPDEGFAVACDDMVIPKDAEDIDLAYAFINFLHTPEIAARNIEYVYYLCPNSSAYQLLSDEIKEDPSVFITEELLDKAEIIRDLGEDNQKYIKVWDDIKSGG
ncbi:MAG: spermidine/putrescine ABC transporter substrate-binding protein [Verrucomicrobiae bacterium]|nr:spermidine/putrescine ABC transporter substrate-binding protein [Verrucomicrobiae bacterium]